MSSRSNELFVEFLNETGLFQTNTLPKDYSVSLNSGENPSAIVLNGNVVEIFYKKLSPPQQQKLKELLVQLQDGGTLFIDRLREEVINKFKSSGALNQIEDQQGFFDSLPSSADQECFKVGIFLKIVFDSKYQSFLNRSEFHTEKIRIESKYGIRGAKILKICVAGYLHSYILPLYGLLKAGTITEQQYLNNYGLIVSQQAFSIFVNERMREEQVVEAINTRLESNKTYGIPFINIHGIGKSNVELIQKVLPTINFTDHGYVQNLSVQGQVLIARYIRDTKNPKPEEE